MTNIIRKTTDLALHTVSAYLFPGCVIVDATCGNGHDTLALASACPSKLYGFDIQQEAVDSTIQLLFSNGYDDLIKNGTLSIICDSHINMHQYVKEEVNAIIFNLGYLPGGDKTKVTSAEDTISAVKIALQLLAKDGILCITMYSGHEEGSLEKESLLAFAGQLDSGIYHAAYTGFINQKNSPPEILMITKKKST